MPDTVWQREPGTGLPERFFSMAVAIGDVIRVTANMLLDNAHLIQNVYHFLVDAVPGPDDDAFMDEMDDILDDLYITINFRVSDRVSYESISGINVTKDELLPSRSWPTLTVGADTDDMIPEMNAACVFHRTIKPRTRASKFLPPSGETSNAGGALQGIYKTACQAFGDFLVGSIIEVGTTVRYGAFNRSTSIFTPVSVAIVPSRYRTQRRRRIGVGA